MMRRGVGSEVLWGWHRSVIKVYTDRRRGSSQPGCGKFLFTGSDDKFDLRENCWVYRFATQDLKYVL